MKIKSFRNIALVLILEFHQIKSNQNDNLPKSDELYFIYK